MPVGGRVPLCLHLCVIPLVTCPGFWINDIIGTCAMVSVPPMCTQAFYWNLVLLKNVLALVHTDANSVVYICGLPVPATSAICNF